MAMVLRLKVNLATNLEAFEAFAARLHRAPPLLLHQSLPLCTTFQASLVQGWMSELCIKDPLLNTILVTLQRMGLLRLHPAVVD